jgi:cobalt-zinc-cadmium efflux system protein
MGHDHSHAREGYGRAFAVGVTFNSAFVALEAVFGLLAHSVALLADAGHNLSDVLGLSLAWGATLLGRRQPTERHTYGLRRSSILAALLNAMVLLVAIGAVAWEAIGRFARPEPVASGTVIWVASVGIGVNTFTALLFRSGRKHDLNVRGAFLHLAADAAVSAGVVLAGLMMRATGWLWLDPAVSLGIVVVIAFGTWGLMRDSLYLALDAVPAHIDPAAVEQYLAAVPGVQAVHDLHVWGMSTSDVALTVHLVKPDAELDDALLTRVGKELHDRFGIEHTTIQLERGDTSQPCDQAPEHVV